RGQTSPIKHVVSERHSCAAQRTVTFKISYTGASFAPVMKATASDIV
ncbi:MAG: hypothetical protein ACI85V_002688, partial [bacterium]